VPPGSLKKGEALVMNGVTEIDAIIANPRRWNAEQLGNLLTFDRLVRVEIARWAPILKAAAASTH
jgi:hypothetical protein